ncbi:MAG: hypothetical protein CMP23_04050 [Rickettsiales bacterium]|nr:hypothetical protein [Rickettsiales bacterium]
MSLALSSSCTIPEGYGIVEDRYVQGENPMVDILFVIDNSTSMAVSQAQLSLAFPTMISVLQALQSDWQMGVISTDMNNPLHRGRLIELLPDGTRLLNNTTPNGVSAFQNALIMGTEGSQLERAFSAAWESMKPPIASHENLGFPRPAARLVVIFLSDEDDCSDEGGLHAEGSAACTAQASLLVPVDDFLQRFLSTRQRALDLSFHAIIETGNQGEFDGCEGSSPGTRYMELVGLTGGSVHPICEDMAVSLQDIALQAAGRRRAFPLSRIPDDIDLEVRVAGPNEPEGVQGSLVRQDRMGIDGWSYQAETNMIQFWGPSVPPPGAQVSFSYPVRVTY